MSGTMRQDGMLEYIKGSDLPDTALWWRDRAGNLIDFSTGWTFTVQVLNEAGEDQFTPKTSNINGAAGEGEYPDGTPNLVITWASTGELDSVDVGSYTLVITANQTSTGKDRIARIPLIIKRQSGLDWTYTADPSNVPLDRIRFLIGDTDPNDPILYDGEIESIIAEDGYGYEAASKAALAIAAKFARKMTKSTGSLMRAWEQQYEHYMELADRLARQDRSEPVKPFASGWVVTEKANRELDADREELFGQKGGMDNRTDGSVTVGWRTLG